MIKILLIYAYTLSIRLLAGFLAFLNLSKPDMLFVLFMGLLILPEFLIIIVKRFRDWIREGIEDYDGKLDRADLNHLLIHYSTLWCIRLFVLFGLLEALYGITVRDILVIGSLFGAFGIETIGFLGRLIKSI